MTPLTVNSDIERVITEARAWIASFDQGDWGNAYEGASDPLKKAVDALEALTDGQEGQK